MKNFLANVALGNLTQRFHIRLKIRVNYCQTIYPPDWYQVIYTTNI